MLDRLVYLHGPGADEIGSRCFGLLAGGYWEAAFAGRLRLASCHEARVWTARADSPYELALGAAMLDRMKGRSGWKLLAYSSRAPAPRPTWYASARFPIVRYETPEPLDRFHALELTASVLALLGSPHDLIADRVRSAVDP